MCEHSGHGSIYLDFADSIKQGLARIRHLVRVLWSIPMPRLMFVLVESDGFVRFEYDMS